MRGRERLQHRDRVHDWRWRHPLVRPSVIAGLVLEDRPDHHGKPRGSVRTTPREGPHAARLQMQNLAHSGTDQISNDDKAGGIQHVYEFCENQ